MDREHVHILLVEDDDIDAELVLRAYRRHRLENPFTIVRDGVEALRCCAAAHVRNDCHGRT